MNKFLTAFEIATIFTKLILLKKLKFFKINLVMFPSMFVSW